MTNLSYLMGSVDAAQLLGVDRETVRRWIHAGKLTAVRGPGGIRAPYILDAREVEKLAAERGLAVAS